jgi:hypothetical protein
MLVLALGVGVVVVEVFDLVGLQQFDLAFALGDGVLVELVYVFDQREFFDGSVLVLEFEEGFELLESEAHVIGFAGDELVTVELEILEQFDFLEVFADVNEVFGVAFAEVLPEEGLADLLPSFGVTKFLAFLDVVEEAVAGDCVVVDRLSASEVLLRAVVLVEDEIADGSGGVVDGFGVGFAGADGVGECADVFVGV